MANLLKKNFIAYYRIYGARFKVRVVMERNNFGRLDLKIKPMSGDGEAWMSRESLEDEDGTPLSEIKATDRDDEDDDSE